MESLVSTEWLAGELGADDLRIVDASLFLPTHGRDARAEYEAAHIPGAMFLDLASLADSDNPLPNMLPPAHKFASRMQSLGIGDGSRVVIYDNSPLHTSARAWWVMRTFGARQVAILDGGMAKWVAEGRPTESGRPHNRHGHFTPLQDEQAAVDKDFMLANLNERTHQVLDARPADRFAGGAADPHGVASGHIPGSKNLPQDRLFNADNTFKRGAALQAEFDAAGVDLDKPLVTTCGSGVTACTLLFGAHLLGKDDGRLYDGSWSEWGADPATPKATAAA
ncbi:MAG: sulfurtransferase [Allosphingosinicella sp.]|uniref:sulfurtransferase n=1 Tax=Allosphingosinicella sp. TaxID=2823234 RepID=UPI0039268228